MTPRPLPARPIPAPGESPIGYLKRLASANGMNAQALRKLFRVHLSEPPSRGISQRVAEAAVGRPLPELRLLARGHWADRYRRRLVCPDCDAEAVIDQRRTSYLAAVCERHARFLLDPETDGASLPPPPRQAFTGQVAMQAGLEQRGLSLQALASVPPMAWLRVGLPDHWQPFADTLAEHAQRPAQAEVGQLPDSPVMLALIADRLATAHHRVASSLATSGIPDGALLPSLVWLATMWRALGITRTTLPPCTLTWAEPPWWDTAHTDCVARAARGLAMVADGQAGEDPEEVVASLTRRPNNRPFQRLAQATPRLVAQPRTDYADRYRRLHLAAHGREPEAGSGWHCRGVADYGTVLDVAPPVPLRAVQRLDRPGRETSAERAGRWVADQLLTDGDKVFSHPFCGGLSALPPLDYEQKALLLEHGLELVGEKTPAGVAELAYPDSARARDSREAG